MLGELSLAGVRGELLALLGRGDSPRTVDAVTESCLTWRVGTLLYAPSLLLPKAEAEVRKLEKYWPPPVPPEGGDDPPRVEGVHGNGDWGSRALWCGDRRYDIPRG